ncbi:MAG: DUF3300 domain-containing protein, partial [Alphaproteobacteria bacterium]
MEGDPDIFRLAQFRHMEMVRFVGAAHVEGVLGAVGAHHAEGGQKLFLLVEIGRAQPAIGELGGFDDGHNKTSEKVLAAMRPLAAHAASPGAAGQAARAPSGKPNSAKIRGLLPKGVAAFRNWLPRNGVCWPEGNRQEREIAACADASLGVACRAKGTRPKNTAKKHGGTQMISFRLRILGQTLPFLLIAPLALAQTPASKAPSRAQATAALNQPANPGAAHYTRQQIDQLVAPIALYPDQLLSQVLMAATYPQQIAEAAQWLKEDGHAELQGDALVQALEPLPWDPSVKALVAFPQVVEMMSEHIEWTEAIGVAFATQQAEVMARVQALRQLAMKSGKLKQVKHLQVRQEGPTILIASAEQDRVYVPVYNPTVVYGQWQDREFPPVYLPPPREFVAETIEPGFEVSRGFAVVAPLWGWSRPDWRASRITVNRTEYTRITRNVEIGPGDTWRHSGPVVLVAPNAVSRTTTVTTNVPAGTVLPGRAAAVVSLPQRAAAQPNLIHSQSTTSETTPRSGQTTTTTSQPGATPSGQTPSTTTAQPSTTPSTQPGQSSTTAAQPSKNEPGKAPATAAQPSATQPGKAPTATAEPGKTEPGKMPAGSSAQPSQATEKSAQPSKEQAGTSHPGTSPTEKNKPAAASETTKPSGQSGKAETSKNEAAKPQSAKPEAAKPQSAKPEASKSEPNMPAREHRAGEPAARPTDAAKGQGTPSPAANLPKEHAPGAAATTPSEPATPRASEHPAPKPATGSSEQPGRAPEHAGAKPPASSASGQSGQRPEEGGAKPSGASQAPGAGPAPGHEPQRAAPPQGGQGSSAAPAATPHQPAPNAQRPNAPGARP